MELAGNYWEFNFVISLKLPLDTPGGVVNTARCATAFLLMDIFHVYLQQSVANFQ